MNATDTADAISQDDHASHHIASFRSLFTILIILLVLTTLTVYTAKFVNLGEFGNLILALLIACFKATLVCAIFMHLLYDKVLNTIVLVICISIVVCFLAFVMIDMNSRGALDPTRDGFIGPPPMARANIDAAIEKAEAEHAEHDEHSDQPPAEDEHSDDGQH